MGLEKRGSDGELGEVSGNQTVVRMHCLRDESISKKNVKGNIKKKK